MDRERPELVFFNGWREKFFMDNPDFRYWVADVRDDRGYRISGTMGDAVYQSITAYGGDAMAARAIGRIDSDDITVDADERFTIVASRQRPAHGQVLEPDGFGGGPRVDAVQAGGEVRSFGRVPLRVPGACDI